MDRPFPWLKHVDARSVKNNEVDFDGMNVENPAGEHLGKVDGFIVDSASSRPFYVAVDAGGWFKSRHFLLPVGHTQFDADREAFVTELSRDRIERFPGVDPDAFEKLSDEDWGRFNNETCQACTITGVSVMYAANEPAASTFERADYSYPDWWRASPTLPDRMGESGVTGGVAYPPATAAASDRSNRDRLVGRGEDSDEGDVDPSPHFDGRAQPGDVLGVETGGEQTHVGDTAEDENQRRRDAESTVRRSKG